MIERKRKDGCTGEQRRHHPNLQNIEEDSKLWLSCMLKCVDNKIKNKQMALFLKIYLWQYIGGSSL